MPIEEIKKSEGWRGQIITPGPMVRALQYLLPNRALEILLKTTEHMPGTILNNAEPVSWKKAKCVLLQFLCNQASHCSLWICVHWNIGSGSHWTSHSHNLSAEYSLSPSTWHNAQLQCWPSSHSPHCLPVPRFHHHRAPLCPTNRLWTLASDSSEFKLQIFHLLVGRENCLK